MTAIEYQPIKLIGKIMQDKMYNLKQWKVLVEIRCILHMVLMKVHFSQVEN